jgi:hypothetical protein
VRKVVTTGLLIFALAFVAFEVSINGAYATDHPTSFVQLDYSLWSSHSVALARITTAVSHSVDDFSFRGQNYSALAPGTAFLALPFLGVAFIQNGGYTVFGPALFWSETFVSLMGALAVYLVYKIASLFFRRSTSVFLGLAFAFSTILWPFATYFFQSDVSAAFVLLAAYFGLRAGRLEGSGWFPSLLCGLSAGVAFTVDYVNLVLLPILLVFLLIVKRKIRLSMAKAAGSFLLGMLPGLLAIGAYNLAIFGNPLVTTEQSYLGQSSILGSFSTPIYYGLGLDLFSLSRGLFVFSPFLVVGIMGFMDGLRTRGQRFEMLLFLAIFLGILLPYAAWYEPDGGLSFGPRFIVAAMPFLLIPSGYIIEQARGKSFWLLYAVYLAGVVMNGIAALVQAIPPVTHFNVSPFLDYILPNFQSGNLGTFSSEYLGHSWLAGGALILFIGALIPIAWVELTKKIEMRELGATPLQVSKIKTERPS